MGCSMVWYYGVKEDISDNLRRIFEENWHITNGYTLTAYDINFLSGLKAAGIKEVIPMIKAIEQHGEIHLKWEA